MSGQQFDNPVRPELVPRFNRGKDEHLKELHPSMSLRMVGFASAVKVLEKTVHSELRYPGFKSSPHVIPECPPPKESGHEFYRVIHPGCHPRMY